MSRAPSSHRLGGAGLPDQALFRIFACLDQSERSLALRVCKQWHRVGNQAMFWRTLSLSYSADDSLIAHLCQGRPWIERLKLGCSRRISPASIIRIAQQLQRLTVLDLEGTCLQLDAAVFQSLAQAGNLRQLNLGSCRISDIRLLSLLTRVPNLLALSLSGIANVDDEALKLLFPAAESESPSAPPPRPSVGSPLHHLVLSGCANVSDAGLALVAARLTSELRVLSVAYLHKITDKGIVFLTLRCPNLVALNLYGCASLTDASLQAIGSRLSRLETLDLSLCSQVTDQGLLQLVGSTPNLNRPPSRLRSLRLYNCLAITEVGIRALAKHCPHLRSLSLYGLEQVTPAALMVLIESCPELRKLDIGGCPLLDTDTVEAISRRYPRIDF